MRATNRAYEVDWVMAFTVRGSKISKFRQFTDTQAIAAAYAPSAKAAG
jgi:ketosteroid isomerase-like protein